MNAECGALSSVLLRKAGSLTCLTDTALQKELLEYRLKKEVPEAEEKEHTVYAGSFKEHSDRCIRLCEGNAPDAGRAGI